MIDIAVELTCSEPTVGYRGIVESLRDLTSLVSGEIVIHTKQGRTHSRKLDGSLDGAESTHSRNYPFDSVLLPGETLKGAWTEMNEGEYIRIARPGRFSTAIAAMFGYGPGQTLVEDVSHAHLYLWGQQTLVARDPDATLRHIPVTRFWDQIQRMFRPVMTYAVGWQAGGALTVNLQPLANALGIVGEQGTPGGLDHEVLSIVKRVM